MDLEDPDLNLADIIGSISCRLWLLADMEEKGK